MNRERQLAILCVFLFILILGFQSAVVVDDGTIGVQRTFGKTNPQALSPGLHFVAPLWISNVTELDTKLRPYEVTSRAASKDMQKVTTAVTVQHSLNPAMAPMGLATIGDLGAFDAAVVGPAVFEAMKAVTARHTAEELITKRDQVANEIAESIQKFIDHTLQEKNVPGALDIANLAIKDFDFSPEFDRAIEAKVQAQQEALRAENEKQKRMTDADAKAYEVEQESTAKAAAIEREAAALTKGGAMVAFVRFIERWDGVMPKTVLVGGNNPTPILDLLKVDETK